MGRGELTSLECRPRLPSASAHRARLTNHHRPQPVSPCSPDSPDLPSRLFPPGRSRPRPADSLCLRLRRRRCSPPRSPPRQSPSSPSSTSTQSEPGSVQVLAYENDTDMLLHGACQLVRALQECVCPLSSDDPGLSELKLTDPCAPLLPVPQCSLPPSTSSYPDKLCGSCSSLRTDCRPLSFFLLIRVAQSDEATLDLVTVDTEELGEIAQKYSVRSLPTVMAFRNGKPVAQFGQ